MAVEQAFEEKNEMMWRDLVVGNCVLIECPSRWYVGVVLERTTMTVRLERAVCGHDLGDLGLFLDGRVSDSTELTPLPRVLELNLATVDSVQAYPAEFLKKISKRTHTPQGERQ